MEIRNYVDALRKRWTTVVGVLVVCVLAAIGITFVIPPTYEADTQLFVSTQTDTQNVNQQLFQGSSFSVDRVKSYAQVATSPKVLEPVRQQLGLTTDLGELSRNVQASIPTDTVLLDVRVTDGSAQQAADLTNAIAAQLGRVIEELETPANGTPSPVKVSILKQAVPATDPVWPSLPIDLAAGVLIGLILGVGVAAVRETLDVSVKDAEDLARVTPLPVLATVVLDEATADRPIVRGEGHDSRSEAYRQLRTNLQFAFVDDKPGVLLVTSPLPGEGKSSVAGNLAMSLQQLGWNVCLVDGDLRRPSVAEYFGLVGEAGLTTVLIGRARVSDVVQSAAPGLDVITSGVAPPNPGELLSSDRMTAVLAELSDRYDMVIVDAPPTLPVADAAALASRADGTLCVVSVGTTTRPQVQLALSNLEQVRARVLGVVLNKAPARAGRGGYYDYSTTYGPDKAVTPTPDGDRPVAAPSPEAPAATNGHTAQTGPFAPAGTSSDYGRRAAPSPGPAVGPSPSPRPVVHAAADGPADRPAPRPVGQRPPERTGP